MKRALRNMAVGFLVVGLAGCSSVSSKITEVVGNDLTRTAELAAAYGKPEVKQCADFLVSALTSEDADLAKLQALLKEETNGLLSSALKAALIAEMGRALNDPAKQAQFQADFDANCKAVAGQIVMNLARDAMKIGSKRIGM